MRAILHAIILFLYRNLSRLDVQGWENIPSTGPALLASNHLGRLDGPLIFALLDRPDASGLVADTYRKFLPLRWLVDAIGGIWVNRAGADFHALRNAREYIQAGHLLGIAPEGTRSKTGVLTEAKSGVAYLAIKTGCPIIPVAIWGTETAVSQLCRLQRPVIHVRAGQPFFLAAAGGAGRSAALQHSTGEIMGRIAGLLPEQYRGRMPGTPI